MPLERPKRKCEDNIKIDLKALGCEDVDWIDLAEVRDRWRALLDTVHDLQVL
jgi:hypothetical protein